VLLSGQCRFLTYVTLDSGTNLTSLLHQMVPSSSPDSVTPNGGQDTEMINFNSDICRDGLVCLHVNLYISPIYSTCWQAVVTTGQSRQSRQNRRSKRRAKLRGLSKKVPETNEPFSCPWCPLQGSCSWEILQHMYVWYPFVGLPY
jgi:hypothetical protein